MKKYIFLAFLVIIGAGGYYLYNNLEMIVRKIVNKYGSEITGTNVDLQGFKLSLTTGEGTIEKITVANPKQYSKPYLFSLEQIYVKVDLKSLTSDTIVINEIKVDKPAITYEMLSLTQNNIGQVLQNIKDYTAKNSNDSTETKKEDTSKAKEDTSGSSKKIIIDKLSINGVELEADIQTPAVAGQPAKNYDKSITLPNIVIKDLGKAKNGETVVNAITQILERILNNASKAVVDNQLGDLKGKVDENLNKLIDNVKDKVETQGIFNKLKI